jgi:exodeoxyribonuclease-3
VAALTIATWNVNSLRLRLEQLGQFAARYRPDVICLQEIKMATPRFPRAAVAEMGYPHIAVRGQKGYHGVAILSRLPLGNRSSRDWCGGDDARHLSATLPGGLEVHNFYVPAGGDIPDAERNAKFAFKLRFLSAMAAWFAKHPGDRLVLAGDLNVAPLENDVWSHQRLKRVVTHTAIEVAHLERLRASRGWVDAVRHYVPPEQRLYTWWSYRATDWAAADKGRRLDHLWVTPALKPRLKGAQVAREVRGWQRPSDHAPVIVTFETW